MRVDLLRAQSRAPGAKQHGVALVRALGVVSVPRVTWEWSLEPSPDGSPPPQLIDSVTI